MFPRQNVPCPARQQLEEIKHGQIRVECECPALGGTFSNESLVGMNCTHATNTLIYKDVGTPK
jgi:hypothetical protein